MSSHAGFTSSLVGVRFNSLNVKNPGWVYLFCIIFRGQCPYPIIKKLFICTYFLFSIVIFDLC